MSKEKEIQDILSTLTDEQKRAVSVFVAVIVNEELKRHGINVEEELEESK